MGYNIGAGGCVDGKHIMYITDNAIIQEFRADPLLSKVNVLVIDEVHERTLHTDIVLFLAKRTLAKAKNKERPPFFVVIASATISEFEERLKNYFEIQNSLSIPGKLFDVTEEFLSEEDMIGIDPWNDMTGFVKNTVVPAVMAQIEQEGNMLVFLPRVSEIEMAMKEMEKLLPKNHNNDIYPLHGSLPPKNSV